MPSSAFAALANAACAATRRCVPAAGVDPRQFQFLKENWVNLEIGSAAWLRSRIHRWDHTKSPLASALLFCLALVPLGISLAIAMNPALFWISRLCFVCAALDFVGFTTYLFNRNASIESWMTSGKHRSGTWNTRSTSHRSAMGELSGSARIEDS